MEIVRLVLDSVEVRVWVDLSGEGFKFSDEARAIIPVNLKGLDALKFCTSVKGKIGASNWRATYIDAKANLTDDVAWVVHEGFDIYGHSLLKTAVSLISDVEGERVELAEDLAILMQDKPKELFGRTVSDEEFNSLSDKVLKAHSKGAKL